MLPTHLELHMPHCDLQTISHSLPFVNLTSLSILDLSKNDFQGSPIPEFIGSFKNLRHLDLSTASFNGMIPSSLGNLSNLLYLDLTTYSYPEMLWVSDLNWLSSLSSLQYLHLGGMNLSMATTNWLQVVNMLPSLLELILSSCELQNFPQTLPFVNFTSLSTLDLSYNKFNSPIPQWLFNISTLVNLSLHDDQLSGFIPKVPGGNVFNLRTLDLSMNDLSGEIEELIDTVSGCYNSTLETIDLSSNKLGGNLPDSLGYFKYLEHLYLARNFFLGPLPTSIGNLSFLRTIDLSFNQMSGTISENVGQLSKLWTLNLYDNSWKGVITENHFQNLTTLTDLFLSSVNKSLVFNVRQDWITPFSVENVAIRDCQLGPAFPYWLKTQASLQKLTLSNVAISDNIPDWFWRLLPQVWWLDLSDNQLRGVLPKSINVSVYGILASIDLGFNDLDGSLPLWTNLRSLSLRNNLLNGPIPLNIGHEMSILEDLDLSGKLLYGRIPPSIDETRNLAFLDLSSNYLFGEIPSSWQVLEQLRVIDLSNNKFSGGIPGSICSLPSLIWLRLSRNYLPGELSTSLPDCRGLIALDLGENRFFGTIPTGKNVFFLSYFVLRGNMLTGSIPERLCQFPYVHVLDLAHNTLSGSIPRCIGNLVAFKYVGIYSQRLPSTDRIEFSEHVEVVEKGRQNEYRKIISLLRVIDLSGNNLIGEIPEEITNLSALVTLNLSSNQLRGRIPENIGRLLQLESLDLSHNHLSGRIPTSMTSLSSLAHLNLSFNNLSGPIPSTNQFATFNNRSIYEGNLGFCGPPLTIDCSQGLKDEDGSEKLWFFISMGLGFIVGFWAVCGTLIIKRSWRHAYFGLVDEMKDKHNCVSFKKEGRWGVQVTRLSMEHGEHRSPMLSDGQAILGETVEE